jgi:serine/threonine protein kinase/thioredoxin-like negative regulator of GroEL
MDYIPGKNLYYYLHYSKPKLVDVLEIVSRLADALAYSHMQKIIHRDLKLNNVIMKDRLTPVLIDFGLAKAMESDDTDEGITRTGEIMGSPSYMAPERFLGGIVDHRSDICSLGIMLYEMIAFKNPYLDQRNLHQTTINVMEANPIPLRKLVPWLPVEIEAITLKAMAKDLAKRYQTMEEFKADINRYQRGEPVLAQPPSFFSKIKRFFKKNWALIVISSLILGFIGAISYIMYNQSAKEQSHWQRVFNVDFNTPVDPELWSFLPMKTDSNFNFNNGSCNLKSEQSSFIRLELRTNGDIKVECDIIAGSENIYNAGIFLFGNNPDSSYCFHINKNGKAFHGITFPENRYLFTSADPFNVFIRDTNHITIERFQNKLLFTINGTVVSRIQDSYSAFGKHQEKIGFFVKNGSAKFDNLKICRRAIPQVPSPSLIADCFNDRGDFESALDEYAVLLLDSSNTMIAHEIEMRQIDCLIQLKRFKDAAKLLTHRRFNPGDDQSKAKLLYLEGTLFREFGNEKTADSVFNVLASSFPNAPVNMSAMTSALLRSHSYLEQAQPLSAQREIRTFTERYKRYPNQWGQMYLQLLNYYIEKGNFESAESIIQEIKGLFKKEDNILVSAMIAEGKVFLAKGKKDRAKEIFDKCTATYLKLDGVWNGWMELAGIYEYENASRNALMLYLKISRECPRSTPVPWLASLKAGELLYRDSIDTALRLFRVAAANQTFPEPCLIAEYYLGKKDQSEFVTQWNRLYPGNRHYLYHLYAKAMFNNDLKSAKMHLSDYKKSIPSKSWNYFRVIKILNNLSGRKE